MSAKTDLIAKLPTAYCVKLDTPINGRKFIVWPTRYKPRGHEPFAIGLGVTARQAWQDALNCTVVP